MFNIAFKIKEKGLYTYLKYKKSLPWEGGHPPPPARSLRSLALSLPQNDYYFLYSEVGRYVVTTILPNHCGLSNFHIIQVIKVKFSMYDDLGV